MWQLLVDDSEIASRTNLVRFLGTIEKDPSNPLIVPEFDYEANGNILFGTLIYDEGRYRLWYMSRDNRMETKTAGLPYSHFCYAESENGIDWNKPKLGIVEYAGTRANNILVKLPPQLKLNNLSVIKTPWDKLQRRYKALLFARPDDDPFGPFRGNRPIYSSDGIHWTEPKLNPCGWSNEMTNLLYDPDRRDYVDINKLHLNEEKRTGRCIAIAKSDDFENWSEYKMVLVPNEVDQSGDEFYDMAAFRYESHYIGLLRVYHNRPKLEHPSDQCIDVQLASSKDGSRWTRICPGKVFIPTGEPQAWDYGRINVGNGPPVQTNDVLWLYYGAQNANHLSGDYVARIGRARLRPCGFAGLRPKHPGGSGEFVTKPFAYRKGLELQINVDALHGNCRVELQNSTGKALPGFTLEECDLITGDYLQYTVRWQGKLWPDSINCDKKLRAKIIISNAKIYAFRFTQMAQ